MPPVDVDAETDYVIIIKEGNAAVEGESSAPLAIIYSTDSFHMAFGEVVKISPEERDVLVQVGK